MEHYDWNEYHENLTAQRQAEARQKAAQQASDATQQTPPAAAQAQQADGQAPGAQVEPQQAASQQAASQQTASQAADVQPAAPQPAKKSKASREEEPPTDWSYGSEPTKKSKKQGKHKERDETPRLDDEQAQAQPQEQPVVQDQRPAQTPSYAQDQSNTPPQNRASAPNASDEYGQPSGQATQQDSSQNQTYDWTEEAKAQDAQQKKKGRKSRIVLIVVLVVVAIAAVALIAYFVMGNAGNTSNSESAEAATPADDVAEDLASALDWLTVYDYDDSYDYDDDEYDYEEEEEETETASDGSIDEFLESYGTFEEVTVTGTGSETFDLPVPDSVMLVTISYEGSGDDDYIFVSTLDAEGSTVTYYADGDSSFSGTITNADYYEYQEEATQVDVFVGSDDIEWTITFAPMSSMGALENGGTYSGSGVYCIDADELSGLSVSYEPEDEDSSFSLTVISPEDELFEFVYDGESLDNEPYEWTDPVCYVIVECDDSEWSISW